MSQSLDSVSASKKLHRMSSVEHTSNNELLNSIELLNITKKLEEQMNNEYQEALKKNVFLYLSLEISLYGVDSKVGVDTIFGCSL